MTAMDVFHDFLTHSARIEELEEMIRRRESAAIGGGARPLTTDGGSRSGGDASMRLLDYVGRVEELNEELRAIRQACEEEKNCALYLTELLPGAMGGVMARICLEGKTHRQVSEELHYSVSHVKRLRREAEKLCRDIQIISWDRWHVPVVALPENMARTGPAVVE